MNYLLLDTRSRIFSVELFKMVRPVSNPGDVTTEWYTIITHPVTQAQAVCINLTEWVNVHVNANLEGLIMALNPTIGANKKNIWINYVKSKTTIEMVDLIQDNATISTHAQLQSAGWFNYPT